MRKIINRSFTFFKSIKTTNSIFPQFSVSIFLILAISCSGFSDYPSLGYIENLNLSELYDDHGHDKDELAEEIRERMIAYNRLLGESSADLNLPHLVGKIDEKFQTKFAAAASENSKIAISSTGGYTDISLEIADKVFLKNISLLVFGVCLSACAEDILPAAHQVTLFDSPLIGFHGNSISAVHFLEKGLVEDPCPANTSKEKLIETISKTADHKRELYFKTNHNIDFWKQQTSRLGEPSLKFYIDDEGNCTRIQSFDRAVFWFPTTKQLEELLGLKVVGPNCADDSRCYKKKLLLYFGEDASFIVGDELIMTGLTE